MRHLQERVAVVTGAASGIGRALAERFGREGMHLVLADVEAPALAETEAALAGTGVAVLAVPTDVARADQVDDLAARAYERFGAVHVLCLNAGVFRGGLVWECTVADWEWVLGVNVWGTIHGIRAFLPRMLEAGEDGHVLVTASMAGLLSGPMAGVYTVSKFAAVALAECLHHDLEAQGAPIGVSVVCPGPVDTRIADAARNRPAALAGTSAGPEAQVVEDMLRSLARSGLAAGELAGVVVDAVRAGRFYVVAPDRIDGDVRARTEAILTRRAPSMPGYG